MRSPHNIVSFVALATALVCFVLLMNITALNPTNRRYSSEAPLTSGQANAQQIGLSAESILARDLKLPRNEGIDQRQCACGGFENAVPTQCNSCFVHDESISSYRIPDFVGNGFIAEAKNRQEWLYTHVDQAGQITDYANIARLMGQPLWVYVRVDTTVAPEFRETVRATGGDVIHYFRTPGYIDSVDRWARRGSVAAVTLIVLSGGRVAFRTLVSTPRPPRPKPPTPAPSPAQPTLDPAENKAAHAYSFVHRSKENLRRQVDRDAAEEDLKS